MSEPSQELKLGHLVNHLCNIYLSMSEKFENNFYLPDLQSIYSSALISALIVVDYRSRLSAVSERSVLDFNLDKCLAAFFVIIQRFAPCIGVMNKY